MEKGRRNALGVGDRILARTEERGSGHVAYPMKRLQAGGEMVVGVLVADTGPGGKQIGRAPVCTPVTNAHLVCRLLLEKQKPTHVLKKKINHVSGPLNIFNAI